jgi:hypothetical protein
LSTSSFFFVYQNCKNLRFSCARSSLLPPLLRS